MGVVSGTPPPLPAAPAELKAFLRITVSDEDALIAGLLRAAADLCEAFTGRALVDRAVQEMAAASIAPIRLGMVPVREIESVAAIDGSGAATILEANTYTVEIDPLGDGRVMLRGAMAAKRLRITYRAGMAADWNGVPEMLRHGIIRLAAHYYLRRGDAQDAELPAAVTALWRPWRQLKLK